MTLDDASHTPDEECGDTGWLVGQTYGHTSPPEGSELIQRCDNCGRFDGDIDAALAYAAAHGRMFVHAIADSDGITDDPVMAPLSDCWVDHRAGGPPTVMWHTLDEAADADWYEPPDEEEPNVDEASGTDATPQGGRDESDWVTFDLHATLSMSPQLAERLRAHLFAELRHIEADDPEVLALEHDLPGLCHRALDRHSDPLAVIYEVSGDDLWEDYWWLSAPRLRGDTCAS